MATSSRSGFVMDRRDGGFYKCEECSKSFNRMASYEAHIRMHAQNELDVLDLVFSYTGKMHESLSSAERRAETRSRASSRRTSSCRSKLSLSPPQQNPKPRSEQEDGGKKPDTVIRLVDLLTDGRNCDKNGVSSTATLAAPPAAAPSSSRQPSKADSEHPPSGSVGKGRRLVGVFTTLFGGVALSLHLFVQNW